MKADLNLKETLMVFDRNCDGTVSYRDFHELLTELNLGQNPNVPYLMSQCRFLDQVSLNLKSVY